MKYQVEEDAGTDSVTIHGEELDRSDDLAKREFPVGEVDFYQVRYSRKQKERLEDRLEGGMEVTWHYEAGVEDIVEADPPFLSDNQLYIRLANLVHLKGPTVGGELRDRLRAGVKYDKGRFS